VELLGGGGGEEDSFEALCSDAVSLLCALASLRGEAVLLLLCGELAPLLTRFSGADAASLDADGAADVVLLADCLVAVLPSAAAASIARSRRRRVQVHSLITRDHNQAASIAPVAKLARHVAAALGCLGQRAASSRPLLAAAVSLLRLVGALCSWLASLLEAQSWPPADRATAEQLLSDCLTVVLQQSPLLLAAPAATPLAARQVGALLAATACRRWPASVHDAAGLQSLRGLEPAAAASLPPPRQPLLLAAACGALLLPPRNADMRSYPEPLLPAWRRERYDVFMRSLCAAMAADAADWAEIEAEI